MSKKHGMTTVLAQKTWYDYSTVDVVDFQKTWYNHGKCHQKCGFTFVHVQKH